MSDEKVFDAPMQEDQLRRHGETVDFDFWYPRIEGHARYLEVGISDVRAADNIRIHYDFDRDGYVIEQPRRTDVLVAQSKTIDTYEERVEWLEVAFLTGFPNVRIVLEPKR